MTTRRNFNTSKVAQMTKAFPQAVITGHHIFMSGMPGVDPRSGKVISDNCEGQMMRNSINT